LIALTANAMVGMKEMFLSKGFDDYLSKPVETAKLNELMEKWVPSGFRIWRADDVAYSSSGPDGFKIEGLDPKVGLERIGGSMQAYLEVLGIYCQDVEVALTALKDVSEENIKDFTIRVHALKSASANIGALALAQEAAFLEEAGGRRDWQFILSHIDGFRGRLADMAFRIRHRISH
jgi:HPt (histidine-containing phosphotransfer) domain-containing protein